MAATQNLADWQLNITVRFVSVTGLYYHTSKLLIQALFGT